MTVPIWGQAQLGRPGTGDTSTFITSPIHGCFVGTLGTGFGTVPGALPGTPGYMGHCCTCVPGTWTPMSPTDPILCVPQAVCCGDHQHCCPRGYTCNVATESCEKLLAPTLLLPTLSAPRQAPSAPRWAPPVPLRATGTHPGGLVPCGAAGSCRRGQRCCQARGGSWGCCPFTQVSGGTSGWGWGWGWHHPPLTLTLPAGLLLL